ncbi:MAG: F0F1 ATP synthase subunit A, partial [Sphaerospermopsis kisseleviana]
MADHNPIFHLKDAYFFEVPKSLWRQGWKTRDSVPQWLRDAHPDATVEEFNAALDGKILIPQPFAELESLYAVKTGFGISKYMILEVVLALILAVVFIRLAAKLGSGTPAKGRLANLLEAMIVFVRDQIARPAIDGHDHHDHDHGTTDVHHGQPGHGHAKPLLAKHDGDAFVPLLLTLFFFVLGCNLLGMLPWAGSPTASFSVTLALAGVTLLSVVVAGMAKFGVLGFFANQVPSMDLPQPMGFILKPMIWLIEMLGLGIKHGVLAFRLLANMVAGHLVLLGIMGLIGATAASATAIWASVTGVSVVSCALFSVLELFVAFLQ